MNKGKIIEILKKNIITKSLVANEKFVEFLEKCTETGEINIEEKVGKIIEVSEVISFIEELEKSNKDLYDEFEIASVVEELNKELNDEEIIDDLSVFLDTLINEEPKKEEVPDLPDDFVPYVKKPIEEKNEKEVVANLAEEFKKEAEKIFKTPEEEIKIDIKKFAEDKKIEWKNELEKEAKTPEKVPEKQPEKAPEKPKEEVVLSKAEIEEVKKLISKIPKQGDIDFKFEWNPTGLEKIPKKELMKALKILEFNLVKVNPELNKNGGIEILNFNLCSKSTTAQFLLDKDDVEYKKYTTFPKSDISKLCSFFDADKREANKNILCNSKICIIKLAGYMWYLQHKKIDKSLVEKREDIQEYIYPRFANIDEKREFILNIGQTIGINNSNDFSRAILFVGNPGLKQAEFAEEIVETLSKEGKFSRKSMYKVHGSTIGTTRGILVMNEYLDKNKKALFIEDADRILNDSGIGEVYNYINQVDDSVVIFTVAPENKNKFLNRIKSLKNKIPYILRFEDYTEEDFITYIKNVFETAHYTLGKDAEIELRKIIREIDINKRDFEKLAYIDNVAEMLIANADGKNVIKKDSVIKLINEYGKEEKIEIVKENVFPKFVGMEEEKDFILNIGKMIENEKNKIIYKENLLPKAMLFVGNQGLGQPEFAEKMVKVLSAEGYFKYKDLFQIHGATIGTVRNTYNLMESLELNEKAVFVEEADRIANDSTIAEFYNYINTNENAVVIFSVSPENEIRFLNRIKALKTKIAYTLRFEDYTEDELYNVFQNKLADMDIFIEEDAAEEVRKLIKKAKIEESFENIAYIEKLIQRIIIKQSMIKPENMNIFSKECIPTIEELNFTKEAERDPNIVDKIFADVYGLKNIIKDFKAASEYLKYRKEMEDSVNNELPKMNMHMAFLGNAGTGKTMMAEKLAKILYNLGCVREDKFIEVTRKDLVSDRLGDTASKTSAIFEKALGGVLLIDEAYTINNSSNLDRECLATIIHALDKYREDLIVIFAGYTKQMEQFFNQNQGLRSRIGYVFDFPDYSTEELYQIFEIKEKYYGYEISEEAGDYVRKILKSAGTKRNIGNARFVENLIQKIFVKKSNNKTQKKKSLKVIEKEDIPDLDEILNVALGNRNENSIETLFDDVYGMDVVKDQIIALGKYAAYRKKVLSIEGKGIPESNMNMIFEGNPGTGKTMIARKVAQLLFDLNVIRTNRVFEVSRKDLVAEFLGQTAPKTAAVVESALGGVLFIDEAYSLCPDQRDGFGKEAVAELIKQMEDHKDDLIVIFAGYTDEMQLFLDTNSGIRSRIGYTIEFPDYSVDELYSIFELKMKKNGFEVEPDSEERIKQLLKSGKNSRKFGNGRFVDKMIQRILINKAKIDDLKEDEVCKITKDIIPNNEDMQTQVSGEEKKSVDDILKDIIGLEKVKSQIHTFMKYVEFKKMLPPESYNNTPDLNLHMLFVGEAGTGKTTLANKMAEILYNAGIIRINKVVIAERKDLVGEYIGHTAPKTQKKIEEAMGGILFIDEAYSLSNKGVGGNVKDFGAEAIETILTAMVTHRNDLIVIFAGYKKEMDDFIKSNSGLMSRIGYTFEFENYSDEQLYEIFQVKCRSYNFEINEEVKKKVMEIFKYFSSVDNFGNGRFVEKVLQEIIMRHAQNPKVKDNILNILPEDVPEIKEVADVVYSDKKHLTLPSDITEKDKKNIAIHELGHAIIHYLLHDEIDIKVITIVPEATGNLGYVLHEMTNVPVSKYKKDYLNRIKVLLAGRAAEEIFIGDVSTGCSSDLQKANSEVSDMISRVGLSESMSLVTINNNDLSDYTKQKIDEEKKAVLDKCYEETKELINKNTNLFYKCLDYLIEKGTISGEELLDLLKDKTAKNKTETKTKNKK